MILIDFFFFFLNLGGDEALCLQVGEYDERGNAVFLARWSYNFIAGGKNVDFSHYITSIDFIFHSPASEKIGNEITTVSILLFQLIAFVFLLDPRYLRKKGLNNREI